jgi:uncharacterized protein (DUF362 family)
MDSISKSKVVLVRSKSLRGAGDGQFDILKEMLSRGISLLHGVDANEAWMSFAKNTGRIGLKPNCVAGSNMSTSHALTYALCDLLIAAGKRDRDLVIWERTNRELDKAGFGLNASRAGIRCFGTDTRDVGYGTAFHTSGKVASLVSRIVESECDHLINLPILKDHSLAGVCGAMKNYYGAIHNPNKYHDNNCDPYVAEVNALPVIREKNILVVMDMTRSQYNAGPGYRASYADEPRSIMMSTDPVAVDAIGERILNDLRILHDLKSLAETGRPPKWLATAEKIGLGNASPENINFIEVEVE